MQDFYCPYLDNSVELTEERFQHIGATHPDLLPIYLTQMGETLADPHQIRRSSRFPNALLFARWFDQIRDGKYVVVVVVTDTARYWIITAYIARKLTGGTIEWQKT